jgi:putative endopeptidase
LAYHSFNNNPNFRECVVHTRAFILGAAFALGLAVLAKGSVTATPQFPPWGVTLDYIDEGVSPGADFFRYSNGGWLNTAVIPPDRQVAGVNLELDQRNEAKLKGIIASLIVKSDDALSSEERKLRDLYGAFEDTAALDAAGTGPIKADLDRIASLQSPAGVAAFMADPATSTAGPFRARIDIDEKNPQAYIVRVGQSGLGMPDRDYYLRDDKALAATREAYKKYVANMLHFAGIDDAARAQAVYVLEARIAQAHWSATDRRDADKTYNLMSISQLEALAPQYPWSVAFAAGHISRTSSKGERSVVVSEKSAFPKLAAIFAETPIAVWRDYMMVRYIHSHADWLSQQIDDADFAFYGTVLEGQEQQLPRDIRGIHLLDSLMGEALGKLYCAQYFPPEAKARSQQLVANLLRAYEADIRTLTWMTPATRAKALQKIRTFNPKIGYPDRWRDYSALMIRRDDLAGDVRNARVFEYRRRLARLDSPVDRAEWGMTPPTNNAYYNPTLNEIVFPAGILQPPYFDPNADDAVNYGEIGATIGHEISHGFDDQGSKFDAKGRLQNWWTAKDRKDFDARTAQLARQYDQYEPLPGFHLNGKLTLGENIADLAGLVIAHKAYHLALGGKPAPVLNALTGDQRFYIAYGQSWREVWTDSSTRRSVLADPHSPPKYRVDGVVRNDDGWYQAFPQAKAGDQYYLPPDQRVRLW